MAAGAIDDTRGGSTGQPTSEPCLSAINQWAGCRSPTTMFLVNIRRRYIACCSILLGVMHNEMVECFQHCFVVECVWHVSGTCTENLYPPFWHTSWGTCVQCLNKLSRSDNPDLLVSRLCPHTRTRHQPTAATAQGNTPISLAICCASPLPCYSVRTSHSTARSFDFLTRQKGICTHPSTIPNYSSFSLSSQPFYIFRATCLLPLVGNPCFPRKP
jgi:hypothetical protein